MNSRFSVKRFDEWFSVKRFAEWLEEANVGVTQYSLSGQIFLSHVPLFRVFLF